MKNIVSAWFLISSIMQCVECTCKHELKISVDFQTCCLTVMLKTFCSIKSSYADSLVRWLTYRNVSGTDCVFIVRVLIS